MSNLTIIVGGQSGADEAGAMSAKRFGLVVDGWAPLRWKRMDKMNHLKEIEAPWLVDWGLKEFPEPGYPARTRANVEMSQAVVLFGNPDSSGGKRTRIAAGALCRPVLLVPGDIIPEAKIETFRTDGYRVARGFKDLVEFVRGRNVLGIEVTRLMVAGNRETQKGAFQQRCENFLDRAFRDLGYSQVVGGEDEHSE